MHRHPEIAGSAPISALFQPPREDQANARIIRRGIEGVLKERLVVLTRPRHDAFSVHSPGKGLAPRYGAVRLRKSHRMASGNTARSDRMMINFVDKMSFGDSSFASIVPAITYRKQLGNMPIMLIKMNVRIRILVRPMVGLTAKNGTTGERRSISRNMAPSRSIPRSTHANNRRNHCSMKLRNR